MNYSCQKKPPVPVTPLDPLDKESHKESIKELTTILSNEWIEEVERTSEEIQIRIPSSTIRCNVHGMKVEVLYNPTVGANIMSATFTSTYFDNEPLAPTNKTCRIAPHSRLAGLGILPCLRHQGL